ncbi:MAG: DNRLRE domain-containing protein [archaeon]
MANQGSFVAFGNEEKGKAGAIPMIVGEEPFYTISQNPRDHINSTCLSDLKPGMSCDVSWSVNATGEINSVWEFYVIANTTNYTNWFSSDSESRRINITIVNQLAPSVPQLNAPQNGSASATVLEFNWTNSTDVNSDPIYYVLQVSNVSNFSSLVYFNGSIPETGSPTGDTPVLPSFGTYYWRVLATDLMANSSWSQTWTFYYDVSAPNLTFINQSGEDNEIVDESHPLDEGENMTVYVEVDDINVDSVWIVVWETVKGGAEKAKIFFTYVGGLLWKAVIPTDYSWEGLVYDYTIYANDTLNETVEYDGNFTMLHGDITLDLSPNPVTETTGVMAFGHLNLTNGSVLGSYPINLWLNGTLLLFSNLTANGAYDNYLNFSDTSNSEFDEGAYFQTESDWQNLTLASGNTSGNFTRIFDAGARVEWDNIWWSSAGHACSAVVSFQEGDSNGYSGTEDTYVDSGVSSSNFGSADAIVVDGSPDNENGLVMFSRILGTGFNQIPRNSTISAANVTFEVYDPGNLVAVYEILENWTESQATHDNRLTGIAWSSDGCEDAPSRSTTYEDTFTAGVVGAYTADITNAARRWVNGTSNNYGIVLDLTTSNGINIRSSEYSTQDERPILTVGYSSDDCTGVDVYVRTSNDRVSWSAWKKVSNGEGINDTNLASRYLEYKVELTSTDPSFTPYLQEFSVNYTAVVTDTSGDYSYNFTNPSAYADYEFVVSSGLRTIVINNTKTLSVQTGVAPEVALLYPSDGQWFAYGNLTFIYNATDINDDMINSTLIINGLINATNSSEILNGLNNSFFANFTGGQYNWTVNVTDSSGFVSTDALRSFYVDLENPVIELVFPPNGTSYVLNELNLTFKATDNLDDVLMCDVFLGEDAIHDDVPVVNGVETNFSSGALTSGWYSWYVTCVDEVGRSNISSIDWFLINDTFPEVTLVWPEENYFDGDGNISFVFNATDNSGFLNCSLIINDSFYSLNQTSINNGQNSTINATGLGEGNHNWTVECFDLSAGSDKASARNFSVDLYFPTISLNSPENYGNVSSADVKFNFTANDTFDSLLDCNLTVDNVVRDTFTASSGVETSKQVDDFTDGEKVWYVTCWDGAGHTNLSSLWRVNVLEPPTVILNTDNETSFDTSDFNLSYTPSDNTNLSSCDLYIDGAFNQTNDTEIINGVQRNFTVLGMSAGQHMWFVNCTDMMNLTNISETRVFAVDTFGPNITLHYPDGHEIGTDNVTFNFTAVDDTDSSFVCNLTVDTSIVRGSFVVDNGTVTNVTVADITDGYHVWFVNCTDSASNTEGSAIFNFTKSTPPQVSLIAPPDGYWFNALPFNLTYLPSDDEGFFGAVLYINEEFNMTNSTEILEFENNTFEISSFMEGAYNWTVKVTDVRGLNDTASPNWTFYLDTTPPQLVLNYPNASANLSNNNVTFNFTVSDNLDLSLECNLYLDGEVDYSDNFTSDSDVVHYALVGDGLHFWNVTCVDEASNFNVSEIINFTIEAPPNVTLVSPNNGAYINYTDTVFVYLPEDPIGITNCSIYIDGVFNDTDTSVTANENNNFTVSNILEGYHNWTVECVDAIPDYNLYRAPVWNLTMDRTSPNITLSSPGDGENVLGAPTFNFSVEDNYDDQMDCGIYIDGVFNVSTSVNNGSSTSQTISGLDLGDHSWNVSCVDNASNLGWSATWSFNVTFSDLYVNESSLVFNDSSPTENQTIQINATVYNLASVGIYNVTVSFYDGHPSSGGAQIGTNQTINYIGSLSQEVATVEWNADLGTSVIFVFVDPPTESNGSIEEWDETNNEANKSISVGGWHFVVGDISALSEFDLAEGITNKSVKRWTAVNYESGNLYVADEDSSVSWTTLQALGKDSSDADASNDFDDIDNLLSMTGFADSVSNLYLNSTGDISQLDTYVIFKGSVDEVPITNSTNNTNFFTGILWDFSDDVGDGEYSIDDVEDLVFVTEIQKDLTGAYGVYDYELRIPATLREYKVAGSREVVLYAELR